MSKPLITIKIGSNVTTAPLITSSLPVQSNEVNTSIASAEITAIEENTAITTLTPIVNQPPSNLTKKEVNRKIRPVSFNLNDPIEIKLNEHANRFTCFSTYIKRLIQDDLRRL